MFKFLQKPTIKSKLLKGGKEAKITLSNVTAEQTMILLFMTMKQIAISMGIEPRHLMNKVIDLDKTVIKNKKVEEKAQRYNK